MGIRGCVSGFGWKDGVGGRVKEVGWGLAHVLQWGRRGQMSVTVLTSKPSLAS